MDSSHLTSLRPHVPENQYYHGISIALQEVLTYEGFANIIPGIVSFLSFWLLDVHEIRDLLEKLSLDHELPLPSQDMVWVVRDRVGYGMWEV